MRWLLYPVLAAGLVLAPWWPGGLPVLPPVEVTIRQTAPPGAGGAVWIAQVTRSVRHLEGLALGDAVHFDRYGVLPPRRGSTLCLALVQGAAPLVSITPLGGEVPDHDHVVSLTRVAAGAALAARACAVPQPELSLDP